MQKFFKKLSLIIFIITQIRQRQAHQYCIFLQSPVVTANGKRNPAKVRTDTGRQEPERSNSEKDRLPSFISAMRKMAKQ